MPLSQKYKEFIFPWNQECRFPQKEKAVENFIQEQLQDLTNDQVIEKVVQHYGSEYKDLAVSIINKFINQSK